MFNICTLFLQKINMDSLNTKRQKICHSITPNYSILEEYHTVLYRLSNGHEKIVKILPNE